MSIKHSCDNAGTDFRSMSRILLELPSRRDQAMCNGPGGPCRPQVQVERIDVVPTTPSDPVVAEIARGYASVMGAKMAKVMLGDTCASA